MLQRPQADDQYSGSDRQRELGRTQHAIEQGLVDGDQKAIERVGPFLGYAPTDEVAHQHRDERHRQARCGRHGVGFGKCQRSEQPAFLRFQRENGDEGQRDDQQGEEQGGAHFGRRVSDHAPTLLAFEFLVGVRVRPVFQVLVGVFDHDHRGIDHGADGDGDAAQRHDVGVDPLIVHDDERGQDPQRQRDDGHECRAQVEQEDQAHGGYDQELLEQLEREILHGALD